jgi:cysteine desulfurase / selenocysteine lyase
MRPAQQPRWHRESELTGRGCAPFGYGAVVVIDIERARRDTPGVVRVAHLNNAGAALPPTQVTEAVIAHLRREAEMGGYEAAAAATEQVEGTYAAIARLISCQTSEIAVVENATRAWDMAFYALSFAPGDRILTARAEYASNVIAFLQIAARTGAVVEVVDNDESGQLSVPDLRRRLSDGKDPVRLVAITHVPTQGGLVNPAEEVGAAAREAGVPFLLDACQSVGQLPVDVETIGCDLLSATGRKFLRGPRGTGFLYVRRGLLGELEPPFLDLHAATWTAPDKYEIRPDARRFENWETNYAAKIGLGVAVEYALSWGLTAIEARVTALAADLRERLRAQPGVHVHDQGQRRCGIVTFTIDGVPAQQAQRHLAEQGVNVSVSQVDHARLDLPARGLTDLVRASVHYYNDNDDLDRLIAALSDVAPRATARSTGPPEP